MATSAMPTFPSRPYAPQQQKQNINQGALGFGASNRERQAQALAQQQAQQNAQQGALAQLSDEQREEINEAVGDHIHTLCVSYMLSHDIVSTELTFSRLVRSLRPR